MSPKPFLILLLLFLSSSKQLTAQSSPLVANSTEPASSYFSTLNITETGCVMTYNRSPNNIITFYNCSTPTINQLSWRKCFNYCCVQASQKTFTTLDVNSLSYCHQRVANSQNDSQSNGGISAFGIAFIILVASFLTVMILCCCCMGCTNCKSRSRQVKRRLAQNHIFIRSVEWQDQSEINYEPDSKIRWSTNKNAVRMVQIEGARCPVCLDDNLHAELHCGHQYHSNCIGEWLGKQISCPCCRKDDIRGIKVYCVQCRSNYYICTRTLLSHSYKTLPLKCSKCKKRNHIKNPERISIERREEGKGSRGSMQLKGI